MIAMLAVVPEVLGRPLTVLGHVSVNRNHTVCHRIILVLVVVSVLFYMIRFNFKVVFLDLSTMAIVYKTNQYLDTSRHTLFSLMCSWVWNNAYY